MMAMRVRALKNLDLREGELDDVVIGEHDLVEMKKQARWLVVARVNTSKPFSTDALFQTLRHVWGLANNPELREVDDNLFTFKFFCLGDWNKVMHPGPWLFRKLVVVIAECDGLVNPADVALDRVEVWSQIHSIPELYRVQPVVDQLAKRIGRVKSVEMTHQRWFEGDYIRVRASIEVNKPLIRFVPLSVGGNGFCCRLNMRRLDIFVVYVALWGMILRNVEMEFTHQRQSSMGSG